MRKSLKPSYVDAVAVSGRAARERAHLGHGRLCRVLRRHVGHVDGRGGSILDAKVHCSLPERPYVLGRPSQALQLLRAHCDAGLLCCARSRLLLLRVGVSEDQWDVIVTYTADAAPGGSGSDANRAPENMYSLAEGPGTPRSETKPMPPHVFLR